MVRQRHDIRIRDRIVGVRSTKQSVRHPYPTSKEGCDFLEKETFELTPTVESEVLEETIVESKGLQLLKKGQKGLKYAMFSQLGIIIILLILQIILLGSIFWKFENYVPQFFSGHTFFVVFMVLYLQNSKLDPTAKLTWMFIIMLFPVMGAVFYWYTLRDLGHRTMKKRIHQLSAQTADKLTASEEIKEQLAEKNSATASLAYYLESTAHYPVFDKTSVTYFPLGEDKFDELLLQLEEAKEFIFLEYFIIDEGLMWGKILEILAKKASEGVDVRLIYDGTNEFSTLPHDYPKRLRELGIKCKVFSPLSPFISTHYNYRDHRKILVIDGHTAFNGGINLADEYINKVDKYGHWKDTAVMLKGEAVKSFTLMFLQTWAIDEKDTEFEKFLAYPTNAPEDAAGYVIPYADCPLDSNLTGERVYMDILNRAKRYVHIMSPYLILDGELETALKFAAERGVEVSLILPGIPDKKIPYALAKTHYKSLLESGIKIYEYTPGFVHAKVFVSDDDTAVVGTINLDYRSLYHHFECATYLYEMDCISEIEEDFQNTLEKCAPVTPDVIKTEKLSTKITGFFLKAFAPLL